MAPDGSYIDVTLRAVQYEHGGQRLSMSKRAYDKLRIDFCDPTVPLPAGPDGVSSIPMHDDFFHDGACHFEEAFSSSQDDQAAPPAAEQTADEFYDDSCFLDENFIRSLQP